MNIKTTTYTRQGKNTIDCRQWGFDFLSIETICLCHKCLDQHLKQG